MTHSLAFVLNVAADKDKTQYFKLSTIVKHCDHFMAANAHNSYVKDSVLI